MPSVFEQNYTPITAAGTDGHIQHVAKLLASQICSSNLIIPDLNNMKYENIKPMEIIKEELLKKTEEDDDLFLSMPAELNLKSYRVDLMDAEDLSHDSLCRILDRGKMPTTKLFKEILNKAVTRIAITSNDRFRNSKY